MTLPPEIAAPSPLPVVPGASPIGMQALDIIASILEDASPGLAEIKLNLRKCMAHYPGAPERALLAHLVETSNRVNSEGGKRQP
ncbi:hypothetical protein [Arthrobacter sp. HS15c]|uniref:hypothetical protein n=1 Tax=Arthrobacter sp. HS15c TaxID=3230279 RepID=UPI003466B042